MHSLTGAADFGVGAFAGLLAIGGADLLLGLLAGAAGAATAAAALGLAPGLGVWFAFGGRGRDRAQRRAMPAPRQDAALDALPAPMPGAGARPAAAPGAPRRDDGTGPSAADAVRKKAGGARPLALSAPGAWLSERLAGMRALPPVGAEGRPAGGPPLPFRLEDGALMPLSRAACRFPGLSARGVEVAAFAREVAVIEGPADLAAAFALLESDGLEFRALVDDAGGETWELICAPRGGEARVDIAPAGPARRELARLRAELRATRAERDAAEAVLDAAPVMAWRRDGAGRVVWGNALYRRMSGAGEAQAETATGVRPGTGARPGAETSAGAEDARRTGRASAAPALPELRGDLGGPEPRADRADPDAPSRGASGSGSASGPDDRVDGRVDGRDSRAAVFDAATGERRWFEISSRVGAKGEDLRFAVDAASAVHAEGALRRFVETLTETFAHIRIGLAIFDREQRLGLFNPAFAELMRLDPAWLAARPDLPSVLEQLRESRRLPDQDDFSQWRRGILGLFGSGDRTDADLRGPRPERTEIWHLPGEEQIRMVARPHPQGAVAFLFEDVTETARLERRFLTETETRRAVMDRLEEGVVTFGPDGVARFANPAFAAMWGFRPDADGDGLRLADAMARFRARSLGGEVWDHLQGFFGTAARSAWSDELTLTDGRRLRARVAALPDGSVLVAFLDVTDALRAEAAMRDRTSALEAAEEIRGALIEQVSLRMRTPLARVSGLTQRLRDGADGGGGGGGGGSAEGSDAPLGPRQLALLEGVLEAAGQMQEALTGVSDLASAQAGVLAMTSEPVNLQAALASALDVARRRAQARGVALSLEADEALDASQEIQGDAQRLRQLLFNLVADAVHRAPRGGWVRAGARKLGDRVEVWTDEPAPEAALDGRSEPEAAVRGGLAHALVRRFAELHGGGVRVELVRRGAPAMSHEALEAEEIGPRGDRLHVVCSLPLAALRAVAPAMSEPPRAERA